MQFSVFSIFDHFPESVTEGQRLRQFSDLAVHAEQLGFDRVWVSEHHFTRYGGIQPRPQMMLSHIAARTSKIRLGSAVTLIPFDNPVRLAEDFALLDALSEGRLDWGVGRGLFPFEYDGMGVSQDESRVRLEEGLDFVLKAWTEKGPFSFDGRFTKFSNLEVLPKPVQSPHPPIAVAALSPASIDWIARRGFDNLQVPYIAPLEVSDERLATWRALLDKAGHKRQPRLTAMMHTLVGANHQATVDRGHACLNKYLALQAEHFPTTSKSKEYEVYARMAGAVKALNAQDLAAGDRSAIGDSARVTEVIEHLSARFAIDEFCCFVNWGGTSHEETLDSLRRFAREVMPRFR